MEIGFIAGILSLVFFILLYLKISSISSSVKEQVILLKQIRDGYKPEDKKKNEDESFSKMFKPDNLE